MSLVQSAYENGTISDVIYSFSPNVPPGYQIEIRPNSINYLPISIASSVAVIRMRITDQNGIEIPLNGETITFITN